MNDEQHRFLLLHGQLPARLTADQVAWLLGFQPHDLPVLMAEGLLKPLGRPAQNGTKFFARKAVEELARDEKWLNRATVAVANHWRGKNERRSQPTPEQPA